MKQSAARTLGVAALGAAIAAAGAGVANAAPAAPTAPDATQALGTASQAVPLEKVSKGLPGAGGAVTQGQSALGAGLESAQPTTHKVLSGGPVKPAPKLLGGLPVQGLPGKGKGKGAGLNGLPLGA